MIDQTGAAAVMVARGAAGNPWLVDSLICRRAAFPAAARGRRGDLRSLLG